MHRCSPSPASTVSLLGTNCASAHEADRAILPLCSRAMQSHGRARPCLHDGQRSHLDGGSERAQRRVGRRMHRQGGPWPALSDEELVVPPTSATVFSPSLYVETPPFPPAAKMARHCRSTVSYWICLIRGSLFERHAVEIKRIKPLGFTRLVASLHFSRKVQSEAERQHSTLHRRTEQQADSTAANLNVLSIASRAPHRTLRPHQLTAQAHREEQGQQELQCRPSSLTRS